jgi:hypothetical protein
MSEWSEMCAEEAEDDSLVFWAEIIKVQTMESSAIRLTLDLPETETVLMAKLAECKRLGAILDIKAIPIVKQQVNNAISEGSKRKSEWKATEETGTNGSA